MRERPRFDNLWQLQNIPLSSASRHKITSFSVSGSRSDEVLQSGLWEAAIEMLSTFDVYSRKLLLDRMEDEFGQTDRVFWRQQRRTAFRSFCFFITSRMCSHRQNWAIRSQRGNRKDKQNGEHSRQLQCRDFNKILPQASHIFSVHTKVVACSILICSLSFPHLWSSCSFQCLAISRRQFE